MQDSEHRDPPVPPRWWDYPHFGLIVDAIKNHVTKHRSSVDPNKSENGPDYILERGFFPGDHSWIRSVRVTPMQTLSEVLYRPQIVNVLAQHIEQLLASGDELGLMVTTRSREVVLPHQPCSISPSKWEVLGHHYSRLQQVGR